MMIKNLMIGFCLFAVGPGAAFVVLPQSQTPTQTQSRQLLWRLAATENANGEDTTSSADTTQASRASFDDAGKSIIDEEDAERLKSMGDFDANPNADPDSMARVRLALQERAARLGIEKSKVSQQYIEQAKQRAQQQVYDSRSRQPGQLDLSQISTGDEPKPRGRSKWDADLPSMMYDPSDELTAEEQQQIDKVGQLPIWEQALSEFQASKWPDFGAVIREVGVMIAVIAVTGTIIINWDSGVRVVYTNMGLIPRKEDIPGQLDDFNIPEGFTQNMNEDDLAGFTEELNKVAKDAGLSSPSVNALLENTIKSATPSDVPDL